MELTEFITARLDEWAADEVTTRDIINGYTGKPVRTRIEHNPPSSERLREVEAMRQIMTGYTSSDRHSPWGGCGDECEWKALEWALRALATIWREHPDFDPAWEA